MSAYTFTLDDRAAQAFLSNLARAGTQPRPLLERVAHALTQRAALTFHDQADPWGNAWAPLAASTLRRRRDGGRAGASILRNTGQFFASLIAAVTSRDAEIRLGFADRPAPPHQFGTSKMPARPSLPVRRGSNQADLPPDWRDEVELAMRTFVTSGGARA